MNKPESNRFPYTTISIAYSNNNLRRRHRPEKGAKYKLQQEKDNEG
jgi:hypothetical protein